MDKIKKLEAARAKVAALEEQIANERRRELAGLPTKHGFASAAEFIAAVKAAAAAAGAGRGRKPGRKRHRAVITEETRAQVKKLIEAGKTGGEIAAALKISLPSVHNIKKALGLVKAKK